MEISGFIGRYSRLCLKLAPLAVLALIWLWFVIAILAIGSIVGPVEALFGWEALV
jgi:hypothetical protein